MYLMQTRSKICVVSFEKVSGFLLFPILCREVTYGFPLINYVFLKGSAIDLSCCKISLTLEYPIKAHVIFCDTIEGNREIPQTNFGVMVLLLHAVLLFGT